MVRNAPRRIRVFRRALIFPLLSTLLVLAAGRPAHAQNWSFDARNIALGSTGTENAAGRMAQEKRDYKSIVIPLGLFQVLSNLKVFNPAGDDFDPVRAIEFGASPIHYNLGRDRSGSADALNGFITDIVNADLNRNLNVYRGFTPASEIIAEGLVFPNWGKTFAIRGDTKGYFHGVYVGAGPYLSVKTAATFDPRLIDMLGSPVDVPIQNLSFSVGDTTTNQFAIGITGGYRAHLPLRTSTPGTRDGLYIAASYHHLVGLRYEDFEMQVRFDTDSTGLLSLLPATQPIRIDRLTSESGRGLAIDVSTAVVLNHWEFGFGVNGIANRIEWDDLERQRFALQSLVNGGDFIETTFPGLGESRRVELPVEYSTQFGYSDDKWSAASQYTHGFQGHNFRTGVERRLGTIDVRGGARLSNDRWHPTVGAGFNLTRRFAVDVALFTTSANLERRRDPSIAVSLRFGR
jgi:hypothetical protein